jgi:hypothetical protein
VSVGGEPPRAVKPNEGLRYRWEGGTVVYCPVGSPMDAKEMTREAFAAWAEARAN